jgi:hypothetical protein
VEEPHIAKIIECRRHLQPHGPALLMRRVDLGMGQFHEIRIFEPGLEGIDEIAVGVRKRGSIQARMRIELGIEIEILVAQPFQLLEIFVMIDGGERSADLPELFALDLARQRSMLDQRVQQIGFANRDELLARLGGITRCSNRHCAD